MHRVMQRKSKWHKPADLPAELFGEKLIVFCPALPRPVTTGQYSPRYGWRVGPSLFPGLNVVAWQAMPQPPPWKYAKHSTPRAAPPPAQTKARQERGPRVSWKGYNACEVIRFLSANQVPVSRIINIMPKLGFTVSPSTVKIQSRKSLTGDMSDVSSELKQLGKA